MPLCGTSAGTGMWEKDEEPLTLTKRGGGRQAGTGQATTHGRPRHLEGFEMSSRRRGHHAFPPKLGDHQVWLATARPTFSKPRLCGNCRLAGSLYTHALIVAVLNEKLGNFRIEPDNARKMLGIWFSPITRRRGRLLLATKTTLHLTFPSLRGRPPTPAFTEVMEATPANPSPRPTPPQHAEGCVRDFPKESHREPSKLSRRCLARAI